MDEWIPVVLCHLDGIDWEFIGFPDLLRFTSSFLGAPGKRQRVHIQNSSIDHDRASTGLCHAWLPPVVAIAAAASNKVQLE